MIDFQEYKRFFTFGCSFTQYRWPTWADIIAKEMPNVEYYNLGQPGAGNLYISLRLIEAHKIFNFCETDLIAVMWSTYAREDRWVKEKWLTVGHIYRPHLQSVYPPGWVKRCANPIFYLMRDFGMISLSNGFIQSLGCQFIELFAQSIDHHLNFELTHKEQHQLNRIFTTYQSVIDNIKYPLLTHMTVENRGYDIGPEYDTIVWVNHNKKIKDHHPSPVTAYEYLNKLNLPLTDLAKNFAIESENLLYKASDVAEIQNLFPSIRTYSELL